MRPLLHPLTAALGLLGLACPAQAQPDSSQEAEPPRTSDFVDTRLTFTFGDDDLLAPGAERLPVSARPSIGDRETYELFYDGLDARFDGRENLTHLVLHREMPAFAEHLVTEAALVMRLDLDGEVTLSDAGSYLRLRYEPWAAAPHDGLTLTLFPLDADRYRLGFLYDLSYGGTDYVGVGGVLRAPGGKAELRRGAVRAHLGVKTVPALTFVQVTPDDGSATPSPIAVHETQLSALGGVGLDLASDSLAVDLGGGYFQRGVVDVAGYPRAQLYALAGSGRVAFHQDEPLDEPLDLRLYENDPNRPAHAFAAPDHVPGRLGVLVALEGIALAHRLADSSTPGALALEPAFAAALRARVRHGYGRIEATAVYRDLAFLLRSTPGVVPFATLPENARARPELLASLAAEWHFPTPRVTLGASVGVARPPSFWSATGTAGAPAGREVVFRGPSRFAILEAGEGAAPIVASRLSGRIDLSEMLWALAWVQHVRDPNQTPLLVTTASGTRRMLQKADALGAGLSIAARF